MAVITGITKRVLFWSLTTKICIIHSDPLSSISLFCQPHYLCQSCQSWRGAGVTSPGLVLSDSRLTEAGRGGEEEILVSWLCLDPDCQRCLAILVSWCLAVGWWQGVLVLGSCIVRQVRVSLCPMAGRSCPGEVILVLRYAGPGQLALDRASWRTHWVASCR